MTQNVVEVPAEYQATIRWTFVDDDAGTIPTDLSDLKVLRRSILRYRKVIT
jgi:hypothetical protein